MAQKIQIASSAEVAKQMQRAGVAMQFEAAPRGSNDWRDCKLSGGSECAWNDWFRYRIKPTETGATNEPKRLQVGREVILIYSDNPSFSRYVGEKATIIEITVGAISHYKIQFSDGKCGYCSGESIRPYDESRPEQDRGRIPVGAKVRVVKNDGEHNNTPVGSEGDLIKDDHSGVPYQVNFGGRDMHWFEVDQIKMIAIPVTDLMHSHRHTVSDGTAGNPVNLTVERTSNGRQIYFVSSQMAEQLRGRIQPTDSARIHKAKSLRDYQRAQLEAYNAFFKPDLGEPYQPDALETDEQIVARLLS